MQLEAENDDYRGLLADPMRPLGMLSSPEEEGNWVLDQCVKTILLFQHFGIDPNAEDAWQKLAIGLARKHVPGFRPPRKTQGRPRERAQDAITLVMLVELLKRRDRLPVSSALQRIAEVGAIPGAYETLRTMHREASKRGAKQHKNLLPLVELLDRVAESIGDDRLIDSLDYAVGYRLRAK